MNKRRKKCVKEQIKKKEEMYEKRERGRNKEM